MRFFVLRNRNKAAGETGRPIQLLQFCCFLLCFCRDKLVTHPRRVGENNSQALLNCKVPILCFYILLYFVLYTFAKSSSIMGYY